MFGFQSQDRTDITVILDRSGSMSAIAQKTAEGFDAFVEKQKQVAGECRLTLVQFDTQYELVYRNRRLHKVPPLNLVPRGGTALLDAMGRTIVSKAEEQSRQADHAPQRTVIVTITDGLENSSREFTRDQIVSLTKQYSTQHDWQFVYLGANQDAIQVAQQMGIDTGAAMTYAADGAAPAKAWQGCADLVARKRMAAKKSMHAACFTASERQASRKS